MSLSLATTNSKQIFCFVISFAIFVKIYFADDFLANVIEIYHEGYSVELLLVMKDTIPTSIFDWLLANFII